MSTPTKPEDVTGRILAVGDWCIYTLNRGGGLEFGYVKEIKVNTNNRWGQPVDTLRIKMIHTNVNGVVYKTRGGWNGTTQSYDITDKDSESWLNYTHKGRFLITKPI